MQRGLDPNKYKHHRVPLNKPRIAKAFAAAYGKPEHHALKQMILSVPA
jgi:hypothetical protein